MILAGDGTGVIYVLEGKQKQVDGRVDIRWNWTGSKLEISRQIGGSWTVLGSQPVIEGKFLAYDTPPSSSDGYYSWMVRVDKSLRKLPVSKRLEALDAADKEIKSGSSLD